MQQRLLLIVHLINEHRLREPVIEHETEQISHPFACKQKQKHMHKQQQQHFFDALSRNSRTFVLLNASWFLIFGTAGYLIIQSTIDMATARQDACTIWEMNFCVTNMEGPSPPHLKAIVE
ncbi:hypothetical protein T4A_5641 [Trichinella pseudospiralis]|uniref:Uncharacterized protein n=1 Tax=Trichinella pseudospiralis TaxID=6337 RepID=A0A0V1EFP4_TRIPS|nr:hypothetical protein T4A_5641 [Trichinella pseudospiralis]KRZ33652.1 hypothetical protein T4C_9238 [Trichinella pseudospiralis]